MNPITKLEQEITKFKAKSNALCYTIESGEVIFKDAILQGYREQFEKMMDEEFGLPLKTYPTHPDKLSVKYTNYTTEIAWRAFMLAKGYRKLW